MKVVLINHSDTLGGASVVTFRLMEALRREGVDARMLVVSKRSDSPWVEQAAPHWRARLPFLAEHLRIFSRNGLNRSDLFKVSIATDGLPLHRHPLVREADAVIFNWVNQGMLSFSEIRRIAAAKPTLWTMHDMWNITGVCHHSGDCTRYQSCCRRCPLLHRCAGDNDLSARTFARKQVLYAASDIRFVAVSNWLADKARCSALTADAAVEMIPNAFDIDALSRPASISREQLGLPPTGRIVLMCAARLDDPVKDLPAAIDALNLLVDTDAVAALVGDIRYPEVLQTLRLPFVHLGSIYDKDRLQSVMAHSSVVLSSSRYESFGATLLEGQAAGVTPVGFVHDGRADIITDGVTGYAAGIFRSPDTSADITRPLGEALRLALEQPIGREALLAAANRYSYHTIATRYINLLGALQKM